VRPHVCLQQAGAAVAEFIRADLGELVSPVLSKKMPRSAVQVCGSNTASLLLAAILAPVWQQVG